MKTTTTDLSEFGWKELDEASKLIAAYADKTPDFLASGVQVMMNVQSGFVFLTDDEYNVAMINPETQKLEQFFSCPECGNEGFTTDYPFDKFLGYCSKKCKTKNQKQGQGKTGLAEAKEYQD